MNRNKGLALLLALLLALSLCACGGLGQVSDASTERSAEASASVEEDEEEDDLPPREEEEVQPFGLGYFKGLGLNPYTCDNAQNQSLMGLLYEPLFELDEHFTAQPVLAKSFTAKARTEKRIIKEKKSKTQTTTQATTEKPKTRRVDVTDITIRLRKDAKFSDGSTVRADDVEYSLRRAAAKGSVYRTRLGSIRNLRTKNRDTVLFTLDGGAQCVAELLDVPIIKNGEGDKLYPIGSGPYTVQRNKKGRPTALSANRKWWRLGEEYQIALSQGVSADGSGEGVLTQTISLPLETIRLYGADDSDELIFGFTSGRMTAVGTDLTSPDALTYTGSYDVSDYATTDLLYLGFNTAQGVGQEQKLRSAVYRSFNREKVVERMMAGHAEPAVLPVHPASKLWDEELAEELAYSRDKARKLCKATGVSGALTLIVNKESAFKAAAAKEIARHLKSAGLNVKAEVLSWKAYKKALQAGNYDLYLGEVVLNATFDLSPLLSADGSLNFSKYNSEALSAAERSFRKAGKDSRQKKAKQLFSLLCEEAPVVPVCFKNRSLLTRSGTVVRERSTQSNLFHWFWDWSFEGGVVTASSGEE